MALPLFEGYRTEKTRKNGCTFPQFIKDFPWTCFMQRYPWLAWKTTWASLLLNQFSLCTVLSHVLFRIALLNPLAVLFSYPCNRSILLSVSPQWAMLFIDLESLAGELFKGISTLDAISLFASCQIRRIFTMKPAAVADGNGKPQMAPRFRWMSVLCFLMMSLPEGSMAGSIPCSYQFPPDVHYTTCVLNMKNLQRGKISKNITLSLLKRLEATWRVT